MFDVGRSSFKTTPYGTNATCERLQNMGPKVQGLGMGNYSPEIDDSVLSETMDEVKEPSMYRVLLHNDDYTSMEFVVDILEFVFNKSTEQATLIMLKVHNEGIGLCGVYTYEVAETKVGAVETLASGNGFPLKCTMEKDL